MSEMNCLRKSAVSSGRPIRRRFLVALCALAAGTSAVGLEPFVGRWDLDSTGSDRIEEAIESCIGDYPEAAKSITRDRLMETTVLTSTLFFSSKGDGAEVLIGYGQAGNGTIAPLDGSVVATVLATGEEMQLTVGWQGDALVERYQAYNGTRTNTYTVAAQGERLTLDVRVTSPEMPTVLTYRLIYVRKSNATKKPGRKALFGKEPATRHSLDGRRGAGRSAWRWRTVDGAR